MELLSTVQQLLDRYELDLYTKILIQIKVNEHDTIMCNSFNDIDSLSDKVLNAHIRDYTVGPITADGIKLIIEADI